LPKKRRKDDDWVGAAIGLGLGLLSLHFLSKLNQGETVETAKTCMFCGHTTNKWARMCPNCRNTFPI